MSCKVLELTDWWKIVDGFYLPVFQYIDAVDFVQQFLQISSAKQVNCAELP